jgi:tryptophan-rich sensory protein
MSGTAEPASSKRSLIALAVALGACFIVSAIGGALTRPNLDWYATLTKPGFTPPSAAFPVVWTILYAMMAVSAWLVWRALGETQDKKTALIWFGIQLAINVLWSFAFFWLHSPALGFGVILALILAIVVTIVLFDKMSRPAALLLIPYVLWVCFAAGLNFTIWVLNSGYDFSQPPA